jgi:hypothetical protein
MRSSKLVKKHELPVLPDEIQCMIQIMAEKKFIFFDEPVTNYRFFEENELLQEKYIGLTFILTGTRNNILTLKIKKYNDEYIIKTIDNKPSPEYLTYPENVEKITTSLVTGILKTIKTELRRDIITNIVIKCNEKVRESGKKNVGGRVAKHVKKELLGKLRCIYKIPGSRKEHVKHKGMLITVSDYKKRMKA